jgi:hypothetical protein
MIKSVEGDRRQAPRCAARHEVCLQASLSMLDAQAEFAEAKRNSLVLYGTTRDLSNLGVALVISNVQIDELFCEDDRLLPVTLFLPEDQIHIEVEPVRVDLIDVGRPEERTLICGKLARMDDDQRLVLNRYLEVARGEQLLPGI